MVLVTAPAARRRRAAGEARPDRRKLAFGETARRGRTPRAERADGGIGIGNGIGIGIGPGPIEICGYDIVFAEAEIYWHGLESSR